MKKYALGLIGAGLLGAALFLVLNQAPETSSAHHAPIKQQLKKKDENDNLTLAFLKERVNEEPDAKEWKKLLHYLYHGKNEAIMEELTVRVARYAKQQQIKQMVAAAEKENIATAKQHLMDLFPVMQTPEAVAQFREYLRETKRKNNDPVIYSVALNLARRGNKEDVLSLFQRLNSVPNVQLNEEVIRSIGQVSNPELESIFYQAALGNGAGKTLDARLAAIAALQNYPSEDTLQLLEAFLRTEQAEGIHEVAREVKQKIEEQ